MVQSQQEFSKTVKFWEVTPRIDDALAAPIFSQTLGLLSLRGKREEEEGLGEVEEGGGALENKPLWQFFLLSRLNSVDYEKERRAFSPSKN